MRARRVSCWKKESYHLFWILLFLWILVKFILKHSGASAWSKWVYLECFVSFHFSNFSTKVWFIDCSFIINSIVYLVFLRVEFCENSDMLKVYSISLYTIYLLIPKVNQQVSKELSEVHCDDQVWFLDTAFQDSSFVCFDNVRKFFATSQANILSSHTKTFSLIKQNLSNICAIILNKKAKEDNSKNLPSNFFWNIQVSTRFFYMQHFFSGQAECCLTFDRFQAHVLLLSAACNHYVTWLGFCAVKKVLIRNLKLKSMTFFL